MDLYTCAYTTDTHKTIQIENGLVDPLPLAPH